MDPNKMSEQELRNEVKLLRGSMRDGRNAFIYTEAGKSPRSPQMCYRGHMPHVQMDRWVRCHLVGDLVVLGPHPDERNNRCT